MTDLSQSPTPAAVPSFQSAPSRLPDSDPPGAASGDVGSLQAFLRSKHQQKAQEAAEPLTVAVRGLDGAFGIRYKFPQEGIAPILKAGQRLESESKPLARLDAALDIILAAHTEIVGRRPDDADWSAPLGDRPLRFGEQLADILSADLDGVKAKSRFLCRRLFSPHAGVTGVYDGDLVLVEHAGEVMNWLRKADADADEALSGE